MSDSIEDLTMQIAQVVPCTEAEGPGKRFALWFQGCPLRCPGCCNPEFLPFKGGTTKTLREMTEWLARSAEESARALVVVSEKMNQTRNAISLANTICGAQPCH